MSKLKQWLFMYFIRFPLLFPLWLLIFLGQWADAKVHVLDNKLWPDFMKK